METTNTVTTRQTLQATQVLSQFKSELTTLAAQHGIDWSQLTSAIRFDGKPKPANALPLNSAANPAYRGNVFVEVTKRVTQDGNRYPIVHFKTFSYGETVQMWDGQLAWQKRQRERVEQKELARKIRSFSAFKVKYQKLPKLNANNFAGCYLARKGFAFTDIPADFELRRGSDQRGGFIAYALKKQQQIVGYQKLYDAYFVDSSGNERNKDFVFYPDSLNSSHAWLGIPPIHKSHLVRHGEGLASCLTAYLADGVPVVICLMASNIPHVARELSNQGYTTLQPIADNDLTEHNDSNVGVFYAITAARDVSDSIIVPQLNGKKCDIDDVRIALGMDAVREQLKNNTLAIPQDPLEYDKLLMQYAPSSTYKKTSNNPSVLPLTFDWIDAKHSIVHSNSRYLEFEIKQGINIPISVHGTGKTYTIEQFIKANPQLSCLSISPIASLTRQLATRFESENYQDLRQDALENTERLTLCLDSLARLTSHAERGIAYDVIVLEEIEQQLRRLTAHVKKKPDVLMMLAYYIKNAKYVFCLDADISPLTVNFIQSLRSNEPIYFAINHYRHSNHAVVLNTREDALLKIEQFLLEGKNVVVPNNLSVETIEAMVSYLGLKERGISYLILNSDNAGDKAQQAFFADANKASCEYRVVFFSPCLSTGVSIENDHFHECVGLFTNKTNNPFDMVQQLHRVRRLPRIHLWIQHGYRPQPKKNYDAVISATSKALGRAFTHYEDNAVYSKLHRDIETHYKMLQRDCKLSLIQLLKQRGYNFEGMYGADYTLEKHKELHKLNPPKESKAFKKAFKQHKDAVALAKAEFIDARVLVSEFENEKLKRKPLTTSIETALIQKYEISDFFGYEAQTKDILEYDNGNLKRIVDRRVIACLDKEDAAISQITQGKTFKQDVHFTLLENDVYQRLQRALNIDLTAVSQDTSVFYDKEQVNEFIGWVCANEVIVKHLFCDFNASKIRQNPYRYIGTMLKQLGIKQDRQQARVNGKVETIGYNVYLTARLTDLTTMRRHRFLKDLQQRALHSGLLNAHACNTFSFKELNEITVTATKASHDEEKPYNHDIDFALNEFLKDSTVANFDTGQRKIDYG